MQKRYIEKTVGYFNLQVSDKYGNFASEVFGRKPQAVGSVCDSVNEATVDDPVAPDNDRTKNKPLNLYFKCHYKCVCDTRPIC